MTSMWESQAARQIRERIARLTPDRRGEWGRMTAPLMVRHVADTLKMALGELQVPALTLPVLLGLVDRLCARAADPAAPWPTHPAFGRLSRRAWGVHIYRHMDHHLRQFRV